MAAINGMTMASSLTTYCVIDFSASRKFAYGPEETMLSGDSLLRASTSVLKRSNASRIVFFAVKDQWKSMVFLSGDRNGFWPPRSSRS